MSRTMTMDAIEHDRLRDFPIGSPERAAWQKAENQRWRALLTSMEICPHGVRDPRACHKCNPGDGARSL